MSKTVLVTGGSRGIGAAICERFAQEGWKVAVNYIRSKEQADALAKKLVAHGCDACAVRADVSDRAQVDQMVKDVTERFGKINALVNNAGIAQQKLFSDITDSDWNTMFDVNVKGMYYCCQAVLPGMIHSKSGAIINVSSMWGITGASCEVHYSAAKAAVIGFTKALAKEVGLSGIRVNCVAPGVVATDMNQNLTQQTLDELKEESPLGLIGTPEDIANCIWFLAGEESRFITGQVISPNGGLVI